MNFFKPIFAEGPSPNSDSDEPRPQLRTNEASVLESSLGSDSTKAWSFSGLIKTLATKSKLVIQTYRKDLQEFGSGLRMKTAIIRDATSCAVKDLLASLEVSTTVAQESLETVGQAIDDIGSSVWKSTAEIITHAKGLLLAGADDNDNSDASESNNQS